ncbi:MAG: site-specific integrase [Paludibacter sp.]|jgi:integrase|nr:site-specific integrase [Paludibacter sp.]
MLQYEFTNGTISLFFDDRRANKDGKYPLRWRLYYRGKRVYYPINKYLSKEEWGALPTSRIVSLVEIRKDLNYYFNEILVQKINELVRNNNFSIEQFNYLLGKSDILSVNDAFNAKIKELEKGDKISNSIIYQCAINCLETFAGKNLSFSQITPKFLKDYQQDMEKKELRRSTIGIYMRCLRAIINNEGDPYLTGAKYPFGKGKYIVPTGSGREMALQLPDIHLLEAYECEDVVTEQCRDMWLFSFYCSGANFNDICKFKYKNIMNGEIYFIRQKTKSTTQDQKDIVVPILEPMQRIIDKHGNDNTNKENYIFPFLNDTNTEQERFLKTQNLIRLTNKKIKLVAKKIGLMDGISTYTARHSYATILAKLRVPESFIAEQLGHSKRTVTQNYFDSYTKEERLSFNGLLLQSNSGITESG